MSVASLSANGGRTSGTAIEIVGVSRKFGATVVALDGVTFTVAPGEIHALLGPNGAGKTTLLRLLAGVTTPTTGTVRVSGLDTSTSPVELRRLVGIVPAGDRTFYLRISGLENLVFFARLHGLSRRAAVTRAHEVLAQVGLYSVARRRVNQYSHGMQKRLSVARALLTEPEVLLVDEATHDLDPEGARRVRILVAAAAERGTAVVWATQRLEEISGFAHTVSVLDHGKVRFRGTVPQLIAVSQPRSYLVKLATTDAANVARARMALQHRATLRPVENGAEGEHVLLLSREETLGNALRLLGEAGCTVLDCREERSHLEQAFLTLTEASA